MSGGVYSRRRQNRRLALIHLNSERKSFFRRQRRGHFLQRFALAVDSQE